MTALGALNQLAREHYLMFDSDHNVDACQCGYPADPSDEGHGDSVVSHLLEVAWADGYRCGRTDAGHEIAQVIGDGIRANETEQE